MAISMVEDQGTGTMIVNLLMFPMMFLGGVMFPIQQMPWFMQDLSKLIPLTYAADAMRKIMLLNASLADVSTDTYISGLSVFLLWLLHYHCSGDQ